MWQILRSQISRHARVVLWVPSNRRGQSSTLYYNIYANIIRRLQVEHRYQVVTLQTNPVRSSVQRGQSECMLTNAMPASSPTTPLSPRPPEPLTFIPLVIDNVDDVCFRSCNRRQNNYKKYGNDNYFMSINFNSVVFNLKYTSP